MAQSLVSDKALIREMSPEELEQEYIRQQTLWSESRYYEVGIQVSAKRLQNIIRKQYYQLTGKTLN